MHSIYREIEKTGFEVRVTTWAPSTRQSDGHGRYLPAVWEHAVNILLEGRINRVGPSTVPK